MDGWTKSVRRFHESPIEMQTLSNVPIEDLRVGDRVKNKATGIEGFISDIVPFSSFEGYNGEDGFLLIIKYETTDKHAIKHAHVPFTIGSKTKCGHLWLM